MKFHIDSFQKQIWDAMSDGVVITDPRSFDNPIIFVNKAFSRLTGYSSEDALGKNCRFLNHNIENSEQAENLNALKQAIEKQTPCRTLLKNRKKDGTYFWNELTMSPLFDEEQKIIHFIGIQRDISREKKIEEELTKNMALYQSLVSNVPGVVYQWVEERGQGNFTYVSEKLWPYFGLEAKDMHKLPGMIHPEDIERWRSSINSTNSKGKDWFFEGRIIYPDGSLKWCQALSQKVFSSEGKHIYNGLLLDVTDRKKLEIALEEEKKKMQLSAKMISLGEMSAGIAHEINNPLSVISGNAGVAQRALGREPIDIQKINDALDKIQKMSDRIAKIIKSLRQFARDDQMDPMIIYSLHSIIDETLDIIRTKLERSGVSISIDVDRDYKIWCRPVQMSQVILNLISNAIDAIESRPEGDKENSEKWIKIHGELDKHLLRLFVVDSGPGIPAAIRDRIMNPFFTTKEVGKGTGLGLSLSKGIAEDHGGDLILDSSAPHTSFILELPSAE